MARMFKLAVMLELLTQGFAEGAMVEYCLVERHEGMGEPHLIFDQRRATGLQQSFEIDARAKSAGVCVAISRQRAR